MEIITAVLIATVCMGGKCEEKKIADFYTPAGPSFCSTVAYPYNRNADDVLRFHCSSEEGK